MPLIQLARREPRRCGRQQTAALHRHDVPEISGVLQTPFFDFKAKRLQSLDHHVLATCIFRCNGLTVMRSLVKASTGLSVILITLISENLLILFGFKADM